MPDDSEGSGMRGVVRNGGLLALCVGLCAALSGCMVQLAPAYDSAIVGGLGAANQDIQLLFAQVGTDVDAATFPARKPQYDKIVGELGAAELQIKTRPMPNAKAIAKAAAALQRLHVAGVTLDPNFTAYPSARAVHDLQDTIQHMEGFDEKSGLRGAAILAFKNQADVFLTQALTYENYLKR
jgi:hypothetical protein